LSNPLRSERNESTDRIPNDDVDAAKRLDRLADAPLAIRNDARVLPHASSAPRRTASPPAAPPAPPPQHGRRSRGAAIGPKTHPLDDGRPDAELLSQACSELARGRLALDVIDGDVCALAGELLCDEGAEAARAGGDEDAAGAERVGHVVVVVVVVVVVGAGWVLVRIVDGIGGVGGRRAGRGV